MRSQTCKRLAAALLSLVLLAGLVVAPAMAKDVSTLTTAGDFDITDGPDENRVYLPPAGVRCYYVDDVDGLDTNDGLTPATAWKTSARVNQVTAFQPGDHILYKRGGTFVGSLVPKGSGTKAAPIVIASYGEGPRPKLVPTPEGNYTRTTAATPAAAVAGGTVASNGGTIAAGTVMPNMNADYVFYPYWFVNNGSYPYFGVDQIRLANVQHYEVRDLELHDPYSPWTTRTNHGNDSYATTGTGTTGSSGTRYRRGILVYNEDAGDTYGYTFDNLVIHGYHGANTNRGKSSGGLIFQVNTNPVQANRVVSAIHDVTVTNCELYDLTRDGINNTSPWANRSNTYQGNNWRTSATGTQAVYHAPYLPPSGTTRGGWVPNKNAYFSNNIFHDIAGDAVIVDNFENAVMENNLVYYCELRTQMAVGIFTWSSSNVTFQYNECYGMHNKPNFSHGSNGDGQGMEIDALCNDIYLQYNYTHDNYGGWMMNCNTTDPLYGFQHVWRYNISKNDGQGATWGVIEWRRGNHGLRAYNNTVIFNNPRTRFFKNDDGGALSGTWVTHAYGSALTAGQGSNVDAQFFNNLFFYNNATPLTTVSSSATYGLNANFTRNPVTWKNNIFYNFPAAMTQALAGGAGQGNTIVYNTNAPLGAANPMIVDPGPTGTPITASGTTTYPATTIYAPTGVGVPSKSGIFKQLRNFMPKQGSPMIGGGIVVNNNWTDVLTTGRTFASLAANDDLGTPFNGGRDFFGSPVTAARVDIGAIQVPDKTALGAALALAALDEADYTAASWVAVQEIIDVYDNWTSLYEEIVAATLALEGAKANLVSVVALKGARAGFVSWMGSLSESTYTAMSWAGAWAYYASTEDLFVDGSVAEIADAVAKLSDYQDLKIFNIGNQPQSPVIRKGMTYQIKINSNSPETVFYVASNANVTVSPTGLVTGVKTGTTVITVIDVLAQEYFTVNINVTS
ncbi:MAG: hypothetical protein FWE59_04460 [Oscillospiraceae bacterium]|nr:hypothetical protein [Oscillospiraceae bacterium]